MRWALLPALLVAVVACAPLHRQEAAPCGRDCYELPAPRDVTVQQAAYWRPKPGHTLLGGMPGGGLSGGGTSVLVPGATGADLTLTGGLLGFQYLQQTGSNTNGFLGPISVNYTAGSTFLAVTGSQVEYSCTGAGTCNFNSASGATADFDCGGGTCTAQLGANSATTTTVGRSGQTTNINGSAAFGTREFQADKVSSGISAGSLLATGTNYSGYKLPQAWTATHMSINVTTASTATVANTVFTTTDGTNTCTFTFACNTDSNTTGVKDKAGVNGAGTGCVYAAAALVTMSVTTQGCATAATVNSITTWGKPQ